MSGALDPGDVLSFWSWFSDVAETLGEDFEDPVLGDEIEERLWDLGELMWELGPGPDGENVLAISPDGDREWLAAAEQVVSLAPSIEGWRFVAGRPVRDPPLEFSIETDRGTSVEVDARDWRYVLSRYPDGIFDILVEARGMDDCTDGDRYRAVAIALDGLLGERRRLQAIGSFEAVETIPEKRVGKASRLRSLGEHLDALVGRLGGP